MVLAVACVVRCFFGESGLFENEPTAFGKGQFSFFCTVLVHIYTCHLHAQGFSQTHTALHTHETHDITPRPGVFTE